MPRGSQNIKTWQKRVEEYNNGAVIGESHIVALRSVLSQFAGFSNEHYADDVKVYLRATVTHPMVSWAITEKQSLKGIAWLRRAEIQKLLNDHCASCVEQFSRFVFKGVKVLASSPYNSNHVLPVYRVIAKDGRWFDYASSPWQINAYDGSSIRFMVLMEGGK